MLASAVKILDRLDVLTEPDPRDPVRGAPGLPVARGVSLGRLSQDLLRERAIESADSLRSTRRTESLGFTGRRLLAQRGFGSGGQDGS